MNDSTLRVATPGDRAAIRALLRGHELPVPDPADAPVHFLVAERGGATVGACGWEIHGTDALLRSVAVADAARGSGAGSLLVAEALRRLDDAKFPRVLLVTLDAADFFARFGFTRIDRNAVPESIRRSSEYRIHECVGGQWMLRERSGRNPES